MKTAKNEKRKRELNEDDYQNSSLPLDYLRIFLFTRYHQLPRERERMHIHQSLSRNKAVHTFVRHLVYFSKLRQMYYASYVYFYCDGATPRSFLKQPRKNCRIPNNNRSQTGRLSFQTNHVTM